MHEELSPTLELNETKEIAIEKGRKLSKFCGDRGNIIDIKNYGGYFDPKEINLDVVLKDPQSNIKYFLNLCKNYLNGLTFTDMFSVDKNGRRKWEDKNIESLKISKEEDENIENLKTDKEKEEYKEKIKEDREIVDIYESNKLMYSNPSKITGFLSNILLKEVEDPELKAQFQKIEDEIKEKTGGLVKKYEDGMAAYPIFSDEKKVEIIKQFDEIVKRIINFLEPKFK